MTPANTTRATGGAAITQPSPDEYALSGRWTALGEDPYGGVVAATLAVRKVLEELAAFCAEATP